MAKKDMKPNDTKILVLVKEGESAHMIHVSDELAMAVCNKKSAELNYDDCGKILASLVLPYHMSAIDYMIFEEGDKDAILNFYPSSKSVKVKES